MDFSFENLWTYAFEFTTEEKFISFELFSFCCDLASDQRLSIRLVIFNFDFLLII